MILQFQSEIDKKIQALPEGIEKTFLEKVKESLKKVKDYSSLLNLLISTAKVVGLSIDQLHNLFR